MTRKIRLALMGSVTTTALVAFATPASAQSCTISPVANPTQNVTCAAGATNNTTNAGTSPAADREYNVTTASGNSTTTVTGALTGNGLAITNTVPGANTLNFANNGSVTVDAAAPASVGGTSAVDLTGIGATNVAYAGNGNITNNSSTGGNALSLDSSGSGNISAVVGGSLVSSTGGGTASGNGIVGLSTGTGNVDLRTNGPSISAAYAGVYGRIINAASAGSVTVINNSAVGSRTGAPNTLSYGVFGVTDGLGAVSVTNNGAIGSSADVLGATGVNGSMSSTTTAATLTVNNSSAVYSQDASIYAENNGTGATNVTNSGSLHSTATGPGIYATMGGTGTTGLLTILNSGSISAATHGIQSSNLGTGGISVTNNAAITAAGMGIRARGLSAAETGPITVQGNGAVTAAGTGIWATSAGTSNVTVNYTGAINSTGDTGVSTSATTGNTSITTNAVSGAVSGIQAVSLGTQTITANGAVNGTGVAGIHSDTTGNRVITVASAGSVKGGAEAILLTSTGTATINNSGTVGAASTGLALNGLTAGATAFNNLAGSTLNGRLTFGAGADSLANSGTFNTQGITDFGAGADVLNNAAAGTINLAGNTTFANLETFTQAGRLNLNTFTLTGTGAFANAGTIDTNGNAGLLGYTSLSNTGTMDLAAGTFTAPVGPFTNSGTIIADEGSTTITGQTSFTNAATGIIDLQDGAVGDVLTLNSSYAGTAGSRLQVDANDTTGDRLVVAGAISGTTAVDANLIGGAVLDNDILVVDGQSTSTANAFVLGNMSGNASPLVAYSIDQVGSDYYLSSSLTAAAFDPMVVSSLIPQLWYPSADEIFANLAVPYKGEGVGFWGQAYYGRDKYGESDDTFTVAGVDYTVNDRVKHSRFGLQTGVDFGMGETGRIGVTAGYGWHKLSGAADMDANGWNIGAYGAFGGPTGFHGEALIKHDRYKPDFSAGAFDGFKTKIRSTGIDGALGYRIPMETENGSLDLAAGVSHVWNKVDDLDAYGIRYAFDGYDSTRGRASARYNFGGDIQPYVSGTIYHEFANGGSVALFDGNDTYTLDSRRRGTWGRIEGGIGGSPNRFPTFAAWADLGDVKGFGARLGMRFGGASEAAPPPPPPPPPAPVETAPATQTCYDGSVILATDTCPVPPPPPPPPPAPERG